ncbi:unnamed protein product [Musa hybrid cultivar]
MDLSTKLQNLDLRSRFLLGSPLLDSDRARIRPRLHLASLWGLGVSLLNKTGFPSPTVGKLGVSARAAVETAITDADATTADLESLFSDSAVEDGSRRPAKKK